MIWLPFWLSLFIVGFVLPFLLLLVVGFVQRVAKTKKRHAPQERRRADVLRP